MKHNTQQQQKRHISSPSRRAAGKKQRSNKAQLKQERSNNNNTSSINLHHCFHRMNVALHSSVSLFQGLLSMNFIPMQEAGACCVIEESSERANITYRRHVRPYVRATSSSFVVATALRWYRCHRKLTQT